MTWRDLLDFKLWLAAAGMMGWFAVIFALLAVFEQFVHG